MAKSRAGAASLTRLLDRVETPIYIVDGRRKIVFVNAAARTWLGDSAAGLLGQECQYHSTPDDAGHVPVAAALCPPPEAFLGTRSSAAIASPLAQDAAEAWRFEFVPLPQGADEPHAVMAIGSQAVSANRPDTSESEDATAAELHARLLHWRRVQQERYAPARLVGGSPAMRRVRAQVALAGGGSANVLIVGPAGSGRQHVARSIHYAKPASALGPLVPLSCSLLGAELLQTTIRALARQKPPTIATASTHAEQRGTLLLNDVDQMPPEAQAELAGFLRLAELPVRILATSERSPAALLDEGKFHRELTYALGTLVIELPPLAERVEDLPLLAQTLAEEINAHGAKQLSGFTPEALDRLAAYGWPGQIAELAAAVAEAHAHAEGTLVTPRDLPARLTLAADAVRYARRPDETIDLEQYLAGIERELIERAIARAKGNKTRAARLLGMTRPRLYRRLVQLGLEAGDDEFTALDVIEELTDGEEGGLSASDDDSKMGHRS